jgi:translation initiation factor IF-2
LLPVIVEKKVTGEATVLQLFDVHLKGNQTKRVAGCRVVNGLVERAKRARVVRSGVTLHEGSLHTLRHMKREITEARKGMECGLSLELFDDLREGDLVQIFQEIERPGVL